MAKKLKCPRCEKQELEHRADVRLKFGQKRYVCGNCALVIDK